MTNKKSTAKPIALAAIAASALAITSYGAFASLSAEANNVTPASINAGTLSLTLSDNGAGFSQSINNMVPGDVVNRYVTINNDGTLDGRDLFLSLAAAGTSTLIQDGASTKALQLSVATCSVAWTVETGTCSGTQTTALANAAFGSLTDAQTLDTSTFAAASAKHLQISLALPEQTEVTVNGVAPAETIQGGTVELTYTFGTQQRIATTTND